VSATTVVGRARGGRRPGMMVAAGLAAATALAGCASSGGGKAATPVAPATTAGSGATTGSGATAGSGATTAAGAPTTGGGASSASGTVALLLPESATTRYENADRPYFTAALKEACPACTLAYSNANGSPATQLQQANAALARGAKVLVLDPEDGTTAGAIVTAAKAKGVPVLSYDRLITGGGDLPQFYISFDNVKVGQLQATALKDIMTTQGRKGDIVWINGSPTDNNATLFKQGAHSVIPTSGFGAYKIGYEIATPDWVPATAQTEMSAAIAKLGKGNIAGVYSANDGMAATIYQAMSSAGISPIPPLTGQDAQPDGIQRILAGQQYMTVYKAIKPEATAAAQIAVSLLQGTAPTAPSGLSITQTTDGSTQVPSLLLTPVAVTKDNVKSTVIADGFVKASDVCTGAAAAACTSLGIS